MSVKHDRGISPSVLSVSHLCGVSVILTTTYTYYITSILHASKNVCYTNILAHEYN